MKIKILITGAGGYIGSVATYLFLENNYEVIGLDNFSTGYQEPLILLQKKFGKNQFRYYNIDLRENLNFIFKKEKNITAVIHYAASCLVNESMEKPEKYFENNVLGSLNLLKAMLFYNIKKIIFSSTCAVYGEAKYLPVDENHPTNPINPYGESKRMVEKIIEWFNRIKSINYIILRYFNVCGASDDGLIGDSKKPSTLLVQNAVRGALGLDKFYLTCPVVETKDKTPIRDYINVVDLNEAHKKALIYLLNNGKSEIINLGTGKGNSVLEIINAVWKITKKRFDLKKTVPRQGEYAKMIASVNKAKKLLNWQPKRTINDSVRSLIRWYQKHPQGWNK